MSLKDDWKQTGTDFGHAFTHLGKSLVRSMKKGVRAVSRWADEDDSKEEKTQKKDSEG